MSPSRPLFVPSETTARPGIRACVRALVAGGTREGLA